MSSRFEKIKEREEKLLCRTYGRYPVAVASGKGSRLYGPAGEEYVDLLAGIAVTNLGHCNEEIAEVMCEQARKLVHVSNLFYQEEQLELAEKLTGTTNGLFSKVFFCNSGAESNEAAIKLARRYTQKVKNRDAGEIITLSNAFHGRTLATVAATGQAKFQEGFTPIPQGFKQVPFGDAASLEAAITDKTIAVMAEVIQGEAGVRPMSQEYAKEIQRICRNKGILFIVDEVQTGMCRSGKFWGFQNYDVQPDIMTSSKALANGLPLGAMLTSDEVSQGFVLGSHATTFGGGALVTSVGAKVVEIMQRDRLANRAAEVGAWAREQFEALGRKYPGTIAEVRGKGLMIGIVLAFPGKEIWEGLIKKGFICNLTQEVVLRLLPALTIPKEDISAFANALGELLAKRQEG